MSAGESRARAFERTSRLAAPPDDVWRHATSPRGVNRELAPWLRMGFPADVTDLVSSAQLGERLFRSWIRLLGVLPVEYDDLTLVEIGPGRRFVERSPLLSQRLWEHERIVEPAPGGARLTDRLRFVPRLALLGPVHAAIFRGVFRWRHRKLVRIFGAPPG